MTCWNQIQQFATQGQKRFLLSTIFYLIISICLLIYYTEERNYQIEREIKVWEASPNNNCKSYAEISIAGSVFMMLGLQGIIGLAFKFNKIAMYFINCYIKTINLGKYQLIQ